MSSDNSGASRRLAAPSKERLGAGSGERAFAAPLAAIDDVSIIDGDGALSLLATKTIDATDPHLRAHFPDFTIFPGVFIIESLRQAVALAIADTGTAPTQITAVRSVRFLAPLLPGDRMRLLATIVPASGEELHVDARALKSDGTVAARLKVDFDRVATHRPPDHTRVRNSLPHAYPMRLVDRVVAVEPGKSITAIKAISGTEPCYQGLPVDLAAEGYAYPISLMLESFGQAAAILCLESTRVRPDDIIVLASARNYRIEGQAYPGDVLRHVARLAHVAGETVAVEGETRVDGRRIAVVESMIAAVRSRSILGGARPGSAISTR